MPLTAAEKTARYRRKHPDRIYEYSRSEYHLAYRRRYAKSERGRETARKAAFKYNQANKVKTGARRKLAWAVESGKMERPDTCERCGCQPGVNARGATLIEASHHDYSLPYDVEWLCHLCHRDKDGRLVTPRR